MDFDLNKNADKLYIAIRFAASYSVPRSRWSDMYKAHYTSSSKQDINIPTPREPYKLRKEANKKTAKARNFAMKLATISVNKTYRKVKREQESYERRFKEINACLETPGSISVTFQKNGPVYKNNCCPYV